MNLMLFLLWFNLQKQHQFFQNTWQKKHAIYKLRHLYLKALLWFASLVLIWNQHMAQKVLTFLGIVEDLKVVLSKFYGIRQSYILGELKDSTASFGWRKNYLWLMVHFNIFRNKTFLYVKIKSWNFQQLFDLGFRETMQNFSLFKQTFRQHLLLVIRVVQIIWNCVRFYEVWNQSRSYWKFQIFILTNKKVLFLKKY